MAWLALALRYPLFLFWRSSARHSKALGDKASDGDNGSNEDVSHRLCTFDELPKWHQDNPYIRSHYRVVSNSYNACIQSLVYLHNETMNIYTHLLPAITLALVLPMLQINISRVYADAPWTDRFMLTLTPMTALLTLSLSSTYHTFMNHSPFVSSCCLLMDFSGILGLILASFVTGIYVGFYESSFHQRVYWSMIASLTTISAFLTLHPKLQGPLYRSHRTAAFILTALSGFAPVIHGVCLHGVRTAYHERGVKWWLAEGFWYGVGATFFASRFPEKWAFYRDLRMQTQGQVGRRWMGRFDVWGHSHQIFHACVVLGAACHCWGVWEAWRCVI